MPRWLDDLNDIQRIAVTHKGGPLLVIAGAGTGKTRTLACRVAWLIEEGVAAERILLLTFTRRASAEMINRAGAYAGRALATQVWGGTFHAIANRLLRHYGRAIGLEPAFTVIDQADVADIMNLVRSDLGLGSTKRRFPRSQTLASIYSRMVNSRTKLKELLEARFPWCADEDEGIRRIFEGYTKRKREQKVLDFDDLLLYWKVLTLHNQVGPLVAKRFDHVLVDEYQDTNALQAEILQAMRPRDGNRNITVVGDDAQSIYSFRAATVENILGFPRQFGDATVVKLEQNYRSFQPILDASNAVMKISQRRYEKNLFCTRQRRRKADYRNLPRRERPVTGGVRSNSGETRRRRAFARAGGFVPGRASQRQTGGGTGEEEYTICKVRRSKIRGGSSRQGSAGLLAGAGESGGYHELVSSTAFARGSGTGYGQTGDGEYSKGRRGRGLTCAPGS